MDPTSRNMEDSGTKCDLMNCGGLAQEVSEEKNIIMLPRDCSYDILVKNVSAFCPLLKSLPEAKMKSSGLIPSRKSQSILV